MTKLIRMLVGLCAVGVIFFILTILPAVIAFLWAVGSVVASILVGVFVYKFMEEPKDVSK